MKRSYIDYEHYYYEDNDDTICYDGSNSFYRRKELNRRKYTGYDTYCGDNDDGYGWN